jgi:hypothetical protein
MYAMYCESLIAHNGMTIFPAGPCTFVEIIDGKNAVGKIDGGGRRYRNGLVVPPDSRSCLLVYTEGVVGEGGLDTKSLFVDKKII